MVAALRVTAAGIARSPLGTGNNGGENYIDYIDEGHTTTREATAVADSAAAAAAGDSRGIVNDGGEHDGG